MIHVLLIQSDLIYTDLFTRGMIFIFRNCILHLLSNLLQPLKVLAIPFDLLLSRSLLSLLWCFKSEKYVFWVTLRPLRSIRQEEIELNTLWQRKTSKNSGKIFENFLTPILGLIYTDIEAKHNLGPNLGSWMPNWAKYRPNLAKLAKSVFYLFFSFFFCKIHMVMIQNEFSNSNGDLGLFLIY